MSFTLKGKAKSPGPRFNEGFKDGFVISFLNEDMCSGKHGSDWNIGGGLNLGYCEGFAEGRVSGWSLRIYGGEKPEWFDEEALKYFNL